MSLQARVRTGPLEPLLPVSVTVLLGPEGPDQRGVSLGGDGHQVPSDLVTVGSLGSGLVLNYLVSPGCELASRLLEVLHVIYWVDGFLVLPACHSGCNEVWVDSLDNCVRVTELGWSWFHVGSAAYTALVEHSAHRITR